MKLLQDVLNQTFVIVRTNIYNLIDNAIILPNLHVHEFKSKNIKVLYFYTLQRCKRSGLPYIAEMLTFLTSIHSNNVGRTEISIYKISN